MMKKKLTLLIFFFPILIMAQEVKNGSIIFDMHPKKNKNVDTTTTQDQQQSDNDDDQQQKKPQKQKKVKSEPSTTAQDDWKKNGLFKALFHAGINGSQIDGDNYAGYNQIGFDGGVGALVRFHKYLSVSMSLDYSMKGARQQLKQDPNATTLSKYQVQWDYLDVPVMINVHDKDLIMFGIGLQPAVMIRYKEWDEQGNDRTSNPPAGTPNVFDLEGVAALHFLIKKQFMLGVKFSYSLIKIRGALYANRFNGEYNNILTFEAGYLLSTVKKKK